MWLKSIYQFHKSFTKVIEKSWLWSYEAVLVEIIWGCPGWDHIRLSWLRSYEACPGWDHKRLSWWRSYEACPGWDRMRLSWWKSYEACSGRDHVIVGYTCTFTYVISVYRKGWEFDSCLWRGEHDTTLYVQFVSNFNVDTEILSNLVSSILR